MDRLKDFKVIADEAMKDITVGTELKQKTLDRCKQKRFSYSGIKALPAIGVCAFLLVLSVNYFDITKGNVPIKTANKLTQNTEFSLYGDNNKTVGGEVAKAKADQNGIKKSIAAPNISKKATKASPEPENKVMADGKAAAKAAAAPKIAMATSKKAVDGTESMDKAKEPKAFVSITADIAGNKDNKSRVQPSFSKAAETTISSIQTTLQFTSIDEVKKHYGGSILTPEYTPEGFKLQAIETSDNQAGELIRAYIYYARADKSFTLSLENHPDRLELAGYSKVEVNGVSAYMLTNKAENADVTEIKLPIGDLIYTIQGSISEEEALRIARNLK